MNKNVIDFNIKALDKLDSRVRKIYQTLDKFENLIKNQKVDDFEAKLNQSVLKEISKERYKTDLIADKLKEARELMPSNLKECIDKFNDLLIPIENIHSTAQAYINPLGEEMQNIVNKVFGIPDEAIYTIIPKEFMPKNPRLQEIARDIAIEELKRLKIEHETKPMDVF